MNANPSSQSHFSGYPASAHSLSDRTRSEFSGRVIPLCDGRPGLRATLQIQASPDVSNQRAPDGTSLPVIDFVSSSDTLDRYEEIIRPEGWQLENYRRNPVFQNAHQYGDVIFTLGKALITEVRATPRPHLFQRIEFAVDVNPIARIAYGLYKSKFLNAVSVGFIPIRWENGDGTEHSVREIEISNLKSQTSECSGRKPAGRETPVRRIYLEQELLEVSAVGIPANPEALQLGVREGAIEKGDLTRLLELLEDAPLGTIIHNASSIIDPSSARIAHPASWACLLSLARALRDLLRRA